MKVAVLFSGGKDSVFALHRAIEQGRDIAVLVAIKSENPYSYMFHIPNIDMVKLQAKAIGIPIIFRKTKGIKEKELKDLELALKKAMRDYKIEGVVSGAVASQYQRFRIEAICSDLGLRSLALLWHLDPEIYLTELIKAGFKVIITSVSAHGFDESWLGRELNTETLEKLKLMHQRYGIHLSGEGGEFETIVLDGPVFKKKIEIQEAEKIWKGDHGQYVIKKAKLVKK
ncbi:TIGR00289 family protein [Candidatus Woesearchaeota archaeon]|nr:TIGR00289 family protein [Candidatus Woesearchaeota archaeon]